MYLGKGFTGGEKAPRVVGEEHLRKGGDYNTPQARRAHPNDREGMGSGCTQGTGTSKRKRITQCMMFGKGNNRGDHSSGWWGILS